jgi:hypothetical protein
MSERAFRVSGGGGVGVVSPVAPELIFANEPTLANSRDFGGLRIRGIFVFQLITCSRFRGGGCGSWQGHLAVIASEPRHKIMGRWDSRSKTSARAALQSMPRMSGRARSG